jgi:hypothetical protein
MLFVTRATNNYRSIQLSRADTGLRLFFDQKAVLRFFDRRQIIAR